MKPRRVRYRLAGQLPDALNRLLCAVRMRLRFQREIPRDPVPVGPGGQYGAGREGVNVPEGRPPGRACRAQSEDFAPALRVYDPA